MLADAVEGAKSLDQEKLADYLRKATIKTVVGDIKFGPNGEWAEPRVLVGAIPRRAGRQPRPVEERQKQTILWPAKYATGKIVYPYAKGKE